MEIFYVPNITGTCKIYKLYAHTGAQLESDQLLHGRSLAEVNE